jgi:hypothetical protein
MFRENCRPLLLHSLNLFHPQVVGAGRIRLLYLLRGLIDIRIAKPLLPLLGVIAPAQFRLLEEADHTDDPKMLAERF